MSTTRRLERIAEPIHVLIVDDEPGCREALGWIFAQAGMTVSLAASVPAARRVLRTFLPDVVVSDLTMPVYSGFDLAGELARVHDGRRIVAVALSGLEKPDTRQLAIDAGFDAYFRKPCEPAELVAAVRQLCSNGGLR